VIRIRFWLWKTRIMMALTSRELRDFRGIWIWVGRVGIAFRRIPRLGSKLMIKRGASWGIRVSQFGPLVVSFPESRR
jgi:hypothetical protein